MEKHCDSCVAMKDGLDIGSWEGTGLHCKGEASFVRPG